MDNRKEQIDMLAKSMIAEGLLDQQFNELLLLEGDGGGFLAEVIKLFCVDCERIVNELSNLLDQPVVEYEKVGSIAHQLKGSSSRNDTKCDTTRYIGGEFEVHVANNDFRMDPSALYQ